MKKITLTLLCVFLTISVFSQEGDRVGVQTELGYGFEFKKKEHDALSHYFQAYITPQYHLNKSLWIGAGAGLMRLNRKKIMSETDQFMLFPVYAAAGYDLNLGGDVVPFVNLKAGYGIMSKQYKYTNKYMKQPGEPEKMLDISHSGGLFLSPSVGINYFFSEKKAITFSLAYHLRQERTFIDKRKADDKYTSGLALMIGFRF